MLGFRLQQFSGAGDAVEDDVVGKKLRTLRLVDIRAPHHQPPGISVHGAGLRSPRLDGWSTSHLYGQATAATSGLCVSQGLLDRYPDPHVVPLARRRMVCGGY